MGGRLHHNLKIYLASLPNIKENGVCPVASWMLYSIVCQTQFLLVLVPVSWKLSSPDSEHI